MSLNQHTTPDTLPAPAVVAPLHVLLLTAAADLPMLSEIPVTNLPDLHTSAAATVTEAMQLLREEQYDCLLLDFGLPATDGFRLLEQLHEQQPDLPVVVLLPREAEEQAEKAIRLGAADYLFKSQASPLRLGQSLRNAALQGHHNLKHRKVSEKLKAVQYQLDFVTANSPINAWSCDKNGALTYLNGSKFSVSGIDTDQAVGRYYADVFRDYPAIVARFDKALAGEQVHSVAETNGRFFKACYVPVRDEQGQMTGITGFAYDVTERIRNEQDLTRAKEVAEQALAVKEQFIANISHEIRTPVSGIIGLARVLQKTTLDQDQQRYLKAIQTSSESLMRILNDLLDFAKISAQKITFEQTPFNLQELIQNTLDLLEGEARARNNVLTATTAPDVPDRLAGDPLRLRQILLNLLGNAVKFTQNGTVKLAANLLTTSDTEAWVVFQVTDNGIGIPIENQQAIFESFNQGNTDITRKYGGTGLGLSITKSLVEMQGGRISVESQPQKGSTFTFTLPFKLFKLMDNDKNVTDQNALPPDRPFGEMRILLAEDNEINQLLVNTVLEEWGCVTDTVANGREALNKLKKNKYDLILMDMQMPEMDGYEAIMKIRQSGAHYAKIPIIALTAHASSAEVEECLATGADGYLSKPFEPEELHENIIRLTTEYRAHSK